MTTLTSQRELEAALLRAQIRLLEAQCLPLLGELAAAAVDQLTVTGDASTLTLSARGSMRGDRVEIHGDTPAAQAVLAALSQAPITVVTLKRAWEEARITIKIQRPLGVAPEAHPYGLPESLAFFQRLNVPGFAAALRRTAEKDRQARDDRAQAALRTAATQRGEALRVCALTLAYLEGA